MSSAFRQKYKHIIRQGKRFVFVSNYSSTATINESNPPGDLACTAVYSSVPRQEVHLSTTTNYLYCCCCCFFKIPLHISLCMQYNIGNASSAMTLSTSGTTSWPRAASPSGTLASAFENSSTPADMYPQQYQHRGHLAAGAGPSAGRVTGAPPVATVVAPPPAAPAPADPAHPQHIAPLAYPSAYPSATTPSQMSYDTTMAVLSSQTYSQYGGAGTTSSTSYSPNSSTFAPSKFEPPYLAPSSSSGIDDAGGTSFAAAPVMAPPAAPVMPPLPAEQSVAAARPVPAMPKVEEIPIVSPLIGSRTFF